MMGRIVDDVIAGLPAERQERIAARHAALEAEVAGLAELRRLAGLPQTVVAASLGIRQPSISKVEKQPDVYISTLRRYVEALGGELELVVRLPDRPPLRLTLGGLDEPAGEQGDRAAGNRSSGRKAKEGVVG